MQIHQNFSGVHTALVTPFQNGSFDQKAFIALLEHQIEGGVQGVVPLGTTGESPTLTSTERTHILKTAQEYARQHQILTIAGTGSNNTAQAINWSKEAQDLGADALLSVTPYYNKPSPLGLYQHFRKIAESVQIPIILYNIPGRCGVEIPVEVIVKLHQECPNIIALKEASGDLARLKTLVTTLPPSFQILSGDDALTLPFLRLGAVGVISVASNLIPNEMRIMVQAFLNQDHILAQALENRWMLLFEKLFIETNPVPIKAALAHLEWMSDEVRLPLVNLSPEHHQELILTLKNLLI